MGEGVATVRKEEKGGGREMEREKWERETIE